MHYLRMFLLILSMISLRVHTATGQNTEIVSQGAAANVQDNLDIARDNATEEALRKAVEQATGSVMENQTLVEIYQLLSDKIYSQSRGYVQSCEVITE